MTLTVVFVVAVSLLVTLYDLWAWRHSPRVWTISHLLQWADDQRWPLFRYLLAAAMLILWAHLFLRGKSP